MTTLYMDENYEFFEVTDLGLDSEKCTKISPEHAGDDYKQYDVKKKYPTSVYKLKNLLKFQEENLDNIPGEDLQAAIDTMKLSTDKLDLQDKQESQNSNVSGSGGQEDDNNMEDEDEDDDTSETSSDDDEGNMEDEEEEDASRKQGHKKEEEEEEVSGDQEKKNNNGGKIKGTKDKHAKSSSKSAKGGGRGVKDSRKDIQAKNKALRSDQLKINRQERRDKAREEAMRREEMRKEREEKEKAAEKERKDRIAKEQEKEDQETQRRLESIMKATGQDLLSPIGSDNSNSKNSGVQKKKGSIAPGKGKRKEGDKEKKDFAKSAKRGRPDAFSDIEEKIKNMVYDENISETDMTKAVDRFSEYKTSDTEEIIQNIITKISSGSEDGKRCASNVQIILDLINEVYHDDVMRKKSLRIMSSNTHLQSNSVAILTSHDIRLKAVETKINDVLIQRIEGLETRMRVSETQVSSLHSKYNKLKDQVKKMLESDTMPRSSSSSSSSSSSGSSLSSSSSSGGYAAMTGVRTMTVIINENNCPRTIGEYNKLNSIGKQAVISYLKDKGIIFKENSAMSLQTALYKHKNLKNKK